MTQEDLDKLYDAFRYLTKAPVGSLEFDGAAEHLRWVLDNKPEQRPHVALVVETVIKKRDEKRVVHRLKELLT